MRPYSPSRRADSAFPIRDDTDPAASITPNRRDLKVEVDRILDKINSEGFGALTPDEKRLLDSAKDLLSRR